MTIATLFIGCTKDVTTDDDDEVITFSLNVTDIADNQATVSVNLSEGEFHGAMIVEAANFSDVSIDYTNENKLIKYVRQNGVNIDSVPYTHTVTGLRTGRDMFTAVIVFKSNGLAVTPKYLTWTADGVAWSDDAGAGSLDEIEW